MEGLAASFTTKRPPERPARGPRHESDAYHGSDDEPKVLLYTEQERGLGADKTP